MRTLMRLFILACAAAIALPSPASAQNMTGGMVTNPPAPVSNGKATLTATYRNLGPGYAYNVNYDVLVPIQPQTWPPESGGFNAMLESTVGTDTNGNDVFWGFDTDTMCNYYLLELQQPNTSGNLPMLPNPFPAGASGSFSWKMPIIPMGGINAGRVVITEPPSLRNSYSVDSAQWTDYSWLTMYAGLYNLVSTGALCNEGGTGCANLTACIGNRLWDTSPFEARLQIGRGNSGDPYLGCGTGLTGFTAGNIAVMRRGTCNFTEKLENAQNAGATGAILVNDGRCADIPDSDPDECVITIGGDPGDGYLIDIPSVLMSRRQGEALIAAVNGGQTVRAKMGAVPADHVDIFSWIFSDADPNLTNDYLVTRVPINLGGGTCTYSLSPTSANYGASGGNGTFSVSTQAGCTWTATANNGWIHITGGASGTGSGTVSYSVDANGSSSSRTGTITAGGRTFTITQSGASSCTYSISPTSQSFGASGGTGAASVSTTSGCSWTASSNNSWIHVTSGSSGTGSGTVNYRVDANSGSARTGTMTIAGHTFTVTQAGGGGGGTYTYQVAGIAHAGGAGGSVWRSTLCVTNRSGSRADLTLGYRMGSSAVTRTHQLQSGWIKEWADVAVSLFDQIGSTSGSIEIVSNVPIIVVARTYNEAPDGTFGQGMPGNGDSATLAYGQLGVLPQLKKTTAFRTNVGLMNHGVTACNVRIKLFSETGSQLGSTINTSVPAKQWEQINDVFDEAGVGECQIGFATIEILTAGGKIWAYGSVVDNGTGDPTTIPLFIR